MMLCLPELSPNYACHVVNMVLTADKISKAGIRYELNPIENHGVEIILRSHTRFYVGNPEEIKKILDDINALAKEIFDFLEHHAGPKS